MLVKELRRRSSDRRSAIQLEVTPSQSLASLPASIANFLPWGPAPKKAAAPDPWEGLGQALALFA